MLCEYYAILVYLGKLSHLGLMWCNTQNSRRTNTMREGATNKTEHEGRKGGEVKLCGKRRRREHVDEGGWGGGAR